MSIYRLRKELVFPSPHLANKDGLLAVGGDLSPERLLLAYENGIFPWYDDESPILWWSPDPRMIIEPARFHCSRSLKKALRSGRFTFSFDTAFAEVIQACADAPRPDQDGTWIIPEMIAAYVRLHELGYAHSIECWENGTLAGGLYGISLGSCFFGESMFSRVTDASKSVMAVLCAYMIHWEMPLLDCQIKNPHLESLGAFEIPRKEFLARLSLGMKSPTRVGKWKIDMNLLPVQS
jgi:leucyl/phenylalanyl-tRNA--protein transferase